MTTGPDSIIMILHLNGDRVESLSSVSGQDGQSRELFDSKVAEALRASIMRGTTRSGKIQMIRSFAAIALSLFLISLVPVAIAATLLLRDVRLLAGPARQAASAISLNRDSLVVGLDRLAQHAEDLSPERDQQLLRDLGIIVRRVQPYADMVRPLFTGIAPGSPAGASKSAN